jgi:hypothetical protein
MMKDRLRLLSNPIPNHLPGKKAMSLPVSVFETCMAAPPRGVHLCLTLLVFSSSLLLVSGCTSGGTLPNVGPITFAEATGASEPAISALTAGQGAYMEVTITNDNALLGANWSVNCESALPPGTPLPPGQTEDTSCGSFTPLHTMSGPVPSYATSGAGYVTFYTAPAAPPKGGTVTLYAASTSDPSRYSSVTLTINP